LNSGWGLIKGKRNWWFQKNYCKKSSESSRMGLLVMTAVWGHVGKKTRRETTIVFRFIQNVAKLAQDKKEL